jgi:hypothetical protein
VYLTQAGNWLSLLAPLPLSPQSLLPSFPFSCCAGRGGVLGGLGGCSGGEHPQAVAEPEQRTLGCRGGPASEEGGRGEGRRRGEEERGRGGGEREVVEWRERGIPNPLLSICNLDQTLVFPNPSQVSVRSEVAQSLDPIRRLPQMLEPRLSTN